MQQICENSLPVRKEFGEASLGIGMAPYFPAAACPKRLKNEPFELGLHCSRPLMFRKACCRRYCPATDSKMWACISSTRVDDTYLVQ